jgi:prolyl-tRNA synthetase
VKEDGQKQQVPIGEVVAFIPTVLEQIQHSLTAQARTFLQDHTPATLDREEFVRLLRERAGMVDVPWCGRPECEAAVKEATSASTRNLREPARAERCVPCGEPARYQAYFAQSY